MRGDEEPRRVAADGFHEGEKSPEENQDAERNGDFFGGDEAESFGEIEEQKIEEDIVPLPDGVNAGSFALLHELREPGIVDVAAEIAGFDVGVPEARNQKQNGNEEIAARICGTPLSRRMTAAEEAGSLTGCSWILVFDGKAIFEYSSARSASVNCKKFILREGRWLL